MTDRLTHIRVHETGSIVRTLCNAVALRTKTKAYKRRRYMVSTSFVGGVINPNVSCDICLQVAFAIANRADLSMKPLTIRRYRALLSEPQISRLPVSRDNDPMKLLEQAQLSAAKVGNEINAKHKRAAKAVRDAKASVARLTRKLAATQTFLKKAKARVIRAEKKLAKTPLYVPPKEGTDEDLQKTASEAGQAAAASDAYGCDVATIGNE